MLVGSHFVGASATPSHQQGVAGVTTACTTIPAQNVAVTITHDSNAARLTKPRSQINLPTPVSVVNLQSMLRDSHYDWQLSQNLIEGFSRGFRIPYCGPVDRACHPRNHPSVLNNSVYVQQMIASECNLGRVAGPFLCPPFDNLIVSPLGLVPKKEAGAFRLIHDLSFPKQDSINFFIPREYCSVVYEDYGYFVSMLARMGQGCYIAKADIESAFRIIPISPLDYHLLGFMMDNQYFYDKCLPMGCSVSCKLFEDFSCAIQWILTNLFQVETMSHILDDFMFLSHSRATCQSYLDSFMSLASFVGIPVKHSKTVSPATCVIVHGIEIDTELMEARLPQDKLEDAINLVRSFARRKKVTLHELQSLIGTLNFACKVIVPGRPFLRRLIDLTIGISRPNFHIRLNNEARLDMAAWLVFLESFNGVSVLLNENWLSSEKLELFTDASNLGFAGVLKGKWFQGGWPSSWEQKHIAIKELFPIVLALKMWSTHLRDRRLLILCDNEAVVYVINKQSSRDSSLMSLIRTLTVTLMQFNIVIRAKHVPGKLNVVADMLSRFQDGPQILRQYGLDAVPSAIPQDLLPWRV